MVALQVQQQLLLLLKAEVPALLFAATAKSGLGYGYACMDCASAAKSRT
jgi:hypothetical protein